MNILACRRPRALLLAACSAVLLAAPLAASAAGSGSAANYRHERQMCLTGQTHQDRATCLKEARNAYADARRGRLDNGETQQQLAANALRRCDVHPAADRAACERMMRGEGRTAGSVEGGGILREMRSEEAA